MFIITGCTAYTTQTFFDETNARNYYRYIVLRFPERAHTLTQDHGNGNSTTLATYDPNTQAPGKDTP